VEDRLIIVDGATFVFSDRNGDVDADSPEGFFYEDVRHLSKWCLTVDGKPLSALTSRVVDHFSARFVGAKEGEQEPTVSVKRDRFVAEGLHEDIVVTNHADEEQSVRLELSFGSDFADILEAQQEGTIQRGRHSSETGAHVVTLWQNRNGRRRGTSIRFRRRGRLRRDRAVFDLRLAPGESWDTCVDVTPVVGKRRVRPLLGCDSFGKKAPELPLSQDEWLEQAPELEADWDPLRHIYQQSLLDLAALRIRPQEEHLRWAMPAGGLPWFMTVFGRDSLVAAYEALPFHSESANATLQCLADLQATEWDDFADAEPGKVAHEVRRGMLAELGEIPRIYYGTHDATLLFLILLDEYESWTGDEEFVRGLEPNVRAALAWMEGPADLDGDGYLEYLKRSDSPTALDNHGWKDSDDSIRFADGRRAEPPIATCEIQGYAYDARLRTARLLREIWHEKETAYSPLEYHNGTVWPHDTALIAEGMRRYGFRDEAGQLCQALLYAAEAFGTQLPEVFAGFPRDRTEAPVEYPGALKPQAWAAGAPLLAIRTLLGLDARGGKVRRSPHVPESLGRIRLR